MKKILLLIITTTLISCETKIIEVEKSAGMVYNGPNKGKSYMIGSDENAKIESDFHFNEEERF